MRRGYLFIETHPDHPGLVRVGSRALSDTGVPAELPDWLVDVDPDLLYAARFSDLEAALMHFHQACHHALADVNHHLYRLSPSEAVIAAESIELFHRRLYLRESLSSEAELEQSIANEHRRHRRHDWLLNLIGVLALILLFIFSFPGF